jgi:hypothetical protein
MRQPFDSVAGFPALQLLPAYGGILSLTGCVCDGFFQDYSKPVDDNGER